MYSNEFDKLYLANAILFQILTLTIKLTSGSFLSENVILKMMHLPFLLQTEFVCGTSVSPLLMSASSRHTPQGSQGGVKQSASLTGWHVWWSGHVLVGMIEGREVFPTDVREGELMRHASSPHSIWSKRQKWDKAVQQKVFIEKMVQSIWSLQVRISG